MVSLSISTPSQSKIRRSKGEPLVFGIDIDGHARLVFRGADRERRPYMGNIGGGGELRRQKPLIAVPVGGHDLQEKIGLTREHVHLAHLGPGEGQDLEGLEIRLRLAREADLGEDRDAEAQRLGIDVGVVAPNEAGLLERAHAPEAGRRRDAGALRQIDVGHATGRLQIAQNASIDLVELDAAHRIVSERRYSCELGRAAATAGTGVMNGGAPSYYKVIILQAALASGIGLPAHHTGAKGGRAGSTSRTKVGRWRTPGSGRCMTARSAWPTRWSASPKRRASLSSRSASPSARCGVI